MPSRATRCSRVSFRSDHQRVRGVRLNFNRIGERVKRLGNRLGPAREFGLESTKPDTLANLCAFNCDLTEHLFYAVGCRRVFTQPRPRDDIGEALKSPV